MKAVRKPIACILLAAQCTSLTGCYRFQAEERPAATSEDAHTAMTLPRPDAQRLSPLQVQLQLQALHDIKAPLDTIQAGDGFNLEVYNESELSLKGLMVQPDGYLHLPLIGPLQVQGKSVEQARQYIETALKKYIREPRVTLLPFRFAGRSITLMGKFNRPGNYAMERPLKLLEAMALGEGLAVGIIKNDSTELADLKRAYMVRNDHLLPIDFYALIKQGQTRYNIPVLPGDYIYIPSVAQQEVYVLGEVLQQNAFNYREGMTLSQLLAYAKGIQTGAYLKQLHLIRGSLQAPHRYIVDYEKILNGTAPDIAIEAGDIIYLPPGPTQQFESVMKTVLPLLQSVQGGLLIYEVLKNNQNENPPVRSNNP